MAKLNLLSVVVSKSFYVYAHIKSIIKADHKLENFVLS